MQRLISLVTLIMAGLSLPGVDPKKLGGKILKVPQKEAAIAAQKMIVDRHNLSESIHIIYDKGYNISFFGAENLHPFDAKKYGRVYEFLNKQTFADSSIQFHTPPMVTDDQLRLVHTQEYLDSLNTSAVLAHITEMPILRSVPNFLLRWRLLKPMKLATGGTIMGAQLALRQHACVVNLSGGYHHAKANSGEGFCVYSDIAIAVHALWQQPQYKKLKVMYIDLDAHQGNGFELIFKNDPRIVTFDVYNKDVYPNDRAAQQYIQYHYPVRRGIEDADYLAIVKNNLPKAINEFKPDLIIYNAGTDPLAGDPVGCMNVSAQGIIERDNFVFEQARRANTPMLMLLSGGYTQQSAQVIGNSLSGIIGNWNR